MPTIFNPLSFFRHVPNGLLEQFFSSVPAFAGFDWSGCERTPRRANLRAVQLDTSGRIRQDLQPLSGGGIAGQSGWNAGANRGRPRR